MKYPLWNKKEIVCYSNFIHPELGPAYLSEGIPVNEPRKRVEYLVKKLNLSEAEQKKIIKRMEEPDESNTEKPDILGSLEERAMKKFGIHKTFFR